MNISLWHKLPEQFNSVFFFCYFLSYIQRIHILANISSNKILLERNECKGMVKKKYFKVVVGPVRDPKRHWNPLVYPPAKDIKLHSKCNGLKETQLPTQWKTKEKKPTWILASLSITWHHNMHKIPVLSFLAKAFSVSCWSVDSTWLRGDVKGTCTSKMAVQLSFC